MPWWGWLEGELRRNIHSNNYTYICRSQTICMATGFPKSDHFKRKEVDITGLLSRGPELLLPYSNGQAVTMSSSYKRRAPTPHLLLADIAEVAAIFNLSHLPSVLSNLLQYCAAFSKSDCLISFWYVGQDSRNIN